LSDAGLPLSRRELLGGAVAAGLGAALTARVLGEVESAKPRIIDTNVGLMQWPFRRLPLDEPQRLVTRLRELGISQAWAGSFEALLHRDIAGVNQRLAAACQSIEELTPIGAVNLSLPDWEEDLRRCVEVHAMPGVRLHPGYHEYTLEDSRFVELLKRAADAKRFVQIAVAIEDVRTQHSLVRVADVDLKPLPLALEQVPGARIQLLNARLSSSLLKELAKTPNVLFDTARVEGTDGIATLLRSLAPHRVLFGSHAPFLIPEAALIRTSESDLTADELRGLLWETAEGVWTAQ
jgi:predicted TIM-barrel fold metal-dependent hydrolase